MHKQSCPCCIFVKHVSWLLVTTCLRRPVDKMPLLHGHMQPSAVISKSVNVSQAQASISPCTFKLIFYTIYLYFPRQSIDLSLANVFMKVDISCRGKGFSWNTYFIALHLITVSGKSTRKELVENVLSLWTYCTFPILLVLKKKILSFVYIMCRPNN